MNESTTNFNDALNSLKQITSTFNVDIYVPSLKTTLPFKEITARQQKMLLETVTDNSLYKVDFSEIFLKILKENILNDFDVNNFTIYDKICIGLGLRNKVSNKLNVIFDEDSKITEEINLNEIVQKIPEYTHPEQDIIKLTKNNVNIEVYIEVPKVFVELTQERELYKNNKKVDQIKDSKEIGQLLSLAFIGEISKYITKIKIKDQDINCEPLTFNQKILISEQLPGDLIQAILTKISQWKEELNAFITVNTSDTKHTKVLGLDNMLFLM